MFCPFAQNLCKNFIDRCHAHTGVNHEQTDIRHINRAFRQTAHAALQTVVCCILKPRGINHGEAQIPKACFAFAQVTGHARLIINQRQPFSNKTVK